MDTILFINWAKVATWTFWIILFVVVIIIFSWIVAELQAVKFKVKYEALKDFIDKAPVDQENYQAIYDLFTYDIYCYSDDDKILITQLWWKFEFKFRSFFPDLKKSQLPETLEEMERNIFSKPKVRIHKTNIKR